MVVCGEGREKGILSGCPGRVVPVLGVLGEEQRADHGCGVWQGKQGKGVCLFRVSGLIAKFLNRAHTPHSLHRYLSSHRPASGFSHVHRSYSMNIYIYTYDLDLTIQLQKDHILSLN